VLRAAAAALKPFNQNVSALISMFAAFGQTEDTVAPTWGEHHLEDFYRELARKAGS